MRGEIKDRGDEKETKRGGGKRIRIREKKDSSRDKWEIGKKEMKKEG